MTKKHFEAIAKILRNNLTDSVGQTNTQVISVAMDLGRYFEEVNPRFDRQKFFDACNPKEV